jgi:polyisoprenoid-binding protein YceI
MAALRPDQANTGAAGAMIGTPETLATPRPGRYEIDTSCSAVTFRTRHLFGLAPVRGSFAIGAGTVEVTEPPAGSNVYVRIDPASFRTGNGQRDDKASTRIDRTEFGVTAYRGMAGRYLDMTIEVRCVRT